jgi:putative hydrolase of the HAD superfamily
MAHHFDEVVELPPELRKPKVEGFWYAAAQLGVEPGELLYVGDSYRCDIEAGVAAGVRPIWVDRWATRLPVPEGVIRVTDLAALPSALA